MKVPILFLVFNRPNETARVFESIRTIRPDKLYVAADGPRKGNFRDIELCRETRAVIDNVDWKCDVHKLFREDNLGCRAAVSQGISWFFDQEEEGIVLEDDCLPDTSFFNFCETMLDRYRDDMSVAHIGGANFQDGARRGDGDYYFSNLTHVWGWASWRRVWKNYDVNMPGWPAFRKEGHLKQFESAIIRKHLSLIFQATFENRIDTWDNQYFFANLSKNVLSIIPNVNLISNIGFTTSATHTVRKNVNADRPTSPITTFREPRTIKVDHDADMYTLGKERISWLRFLILTIAHGISGK